tara:strand:- start:573 stop:728 length:156 start_codon:yes stop_codon:yes gene_type:complete
MSEKTTVCAECGSSEWSDFENMMRVTGQEGTSPEEIVVAKCECCGSRQEVK